MPQTYTVTVFAEVTEARTLKAPPTSAPVVLLTSTAWPTVALVTVAVPESHVELSAVPVMVPVVPSSRTVGQLVPLAVQMFDRLPMGPRL